MGLLVKHFTRGQAPGLVERHTRHFKRLPLVIRHFLHHKHLRQGVGMGDRAVFIDRAHRVVMVIARSQLRTVGEPRFS